MVKLHSIVENGQVDACRELLRKPNLHKDTALHYAVRGGHESVVKLLIEEDPQLGGVTNAADESPLYLATDRGHLYIMELILHASVLPSSHKGPKGLTALYVAIHRPLAGWQKILNSRPELIRERDEMGWTPIHYVASKGKFKAVQQLLQHDISVAYDLDKEGQSALHIAAFLGYSLVIDEIVKFCPTLHAAVMGGEADVVKDILRRPNLEYLIKEQDTDGNTALHLAALHKDYTIIDILARDKRVDRFITNNDHMTALDIFLVHNEVGCSAAKVNYLLKESCGMSDFQGGVIEKIKKMLDKQFVEGQPGASIITGSNIANRENSDSSTKNLINLQQLMATLIATVTFAATFTMPGGYNNDGPNRGMAILADREAFQAFVLLNITAFSFSVVALFIQFDPWVPGPRYEVRYTYPVGLCIFIAIWAMVLAFACGTYVVLTGTIELGISPFIIGGCIVIMYIICNSLDPIVILNRPPHYPGRYVRNLLFKYKIL
ncbi:hypothetical protein EUGRSUZ_D01267 [Eucalyptus grandis]|uniref:PGG domain-containing protein n=1 Tax=Eucalyptus grandis TaxID=71139 RepID=A0A059CFJ6_EUCGR|nr:hypothetical protein EUGRSUZ_D01267 [Eucalyptus grandis]